MLHPSLFSGSFSIRSLIRRVYRFGLLRILHGVLANQIVSGGLVHDLKEHSSELCNIRIGKTVLLHFMDIILHVEGPDIHELSFPEVFLQLPNCVSVAFLGRFLDSA